MYRLILFIVIHLTLRTSGYSENNQLTETILDEKVIILNPDLPPTIEYICLKNDRPDIDYNYFWEKNLQVEQITDLGWEKNHTYVGNSLYLSTISSSSISDWLLGKYLENIDTELPLESFLFEESNKIEAFLNKQRVIQLKELFELNIDLADRDQTYPPSTTNIDPKLKARSPKNPSSDQGFGKFAFYLIIGGGICLIYSVLAPSGTSQKGDSKSEKIKLARRKRWLTKIFEKGWIDRPTYHFLLQKIENLPEWLGGIKPTNQSTDGVLTDDETSVDFRRRKRGESVVRTKDTSEDKISR